MATPWRYEPISQRRRRDEEEFQRYADERMQQMEQESGGLLGSIGGAIGDAAGAVSDIPGASEVGGGIADVYQAGQSGLRTVLGTATGTTGFDRRRDPETGQRYREHGGFFDQLGSMAEGYGNLLRDPIGTIQESGQAYEELSRDPEAGLISRAIYGAASAPEMYATAGAGGLLGQGLRQGGRLGRGAANLVEPVVGGSFVRRGVGELGLETGARAGSEAAGEHFGPVGALAGGLAGGIGGAQLGRSVPGSQPFRQAGETATEQAGRQGARQVEDTGQLGSTNISGSGERMFPWLDPERREPLRQRDYRLNIAKRLLGKASKEEDPIITPIAREYETLRKVVPESQATLVSQRAGQYKNLFKGQLDKKTGVIDLDPSPATLQDIAARLPEYRPYLTDEQVAFIEDLGSVFERMHIELREAGVDVGVRPDVMEGGFYIPRGAATKEGVDAPKKVSSGRGVRGSKTGSMRPARFDSMAEGIQKGHEYRPVDEVVYDYVKRNGEYIYDNQVAGVLRETVGEGGELLGKTMKDRIDPQIRDQYQSVRTQMVRIRDKIRRAENRAGVESRATDELDRALDDVAEGTPAGGFRAASRIPGRIRQESRRAGLTSEAEDLLQQVDKGSVPFAVTNNLRRIARANGIDPGNKSAQDIIGELQRRRSAGMRGKAEDLRSDEMRSPEGFPEVRINMPATGTNRRRAAERDMRADEIQRTLRNVEEAVPEDLEQVRFMDTAIKNTLDRAEELAKRGGEAGQRAQSLRDQLRQAQEEFDRLKGPYRKELERARSTPPDQQTIALSQMNGWTFPIKAAAAFNKRVRQESGPIENIIETGNQFLRALASTADLSALGIHGLLAGAAQPRAFGKAAWHSIEAFFYEDVARSAIAELDQVYRGKGAMTSEEWAASGLHFGSTRTEFTPAGEGVGAIGQAMQRLPVFKESARAFGGFGDVMRLQMANSIAERASKQGIDVSTRKAREEIAMTANLMTGWTPGRLAGRLGGFATYAPRMYQAQFDITAKALANGDISGKEARRAFRHLLGAGTAFVIAANELSPDGMGPEEYFKPFRGDGPAGDPRQGWNSNFLRFRVAGQDISPFGTWDSLARLVAEAGMGIATGDMERAAGSIRAKSSPLMSIAWDQFTGETFLGDDASLTNPTYLLDNLLPISVGQAVEDIPEAWEGGLTDNLGSNLPRAAMQTASETVGLKTSPESSYEKAEQVFSNDDTYKVPNADGELKTASSYWDLNKAQRAKFDEEHPNLAADIKNDPSEELQQYEQVKEMLAKEQQVSDMRLIENEISIDEWRDQFNDRRTFLRGAGEALFEDDEEQKEPESTGDLYNQIIEENMLPDGSIQWEKVDGQVANLTPAQQQWIADNRSLGMTGLTQRYLSTSDERDRYYSLPKYRGYSGDEAQQIDDVYDRARATLNLPRGQRAPQMRMLRAIREVSQQLGIDPKIARGARRRVMGMITQTNDRDRFLEEHPEVAAFTTSGYLTPDQQNAIGGVDSVLSGEQRRR